ncbi:MAG: sensor histidine kinase [Planctomycetaceae bacterium]
MTHASPPGDGDRGILEARLEAARALAYGAGHEINNPLANIAARAQALLADEQDPERRRKLATIVDQAFRARDMIGGLMVYARPPRPNPAVVDVHDMLRGVVEAVRPAADSRGARLDCSPPPAAVGVLVDAAQVVEALRALTLNAIEAVGDAGRVVIEAEARGGGISIAVVDDGPGMTADGVRRAFDPFYSGRDAGRGIGLGLPKAVRLIEQNGGTLAVDSRPGAGTRVAVTLPGVPVAAES